MLGNIPYSAIMNASINQAFVPDWTSIIINNHLIIIKISIFIFLIILYFKYLHFNHMAFVFSRIKLGLIHRRSVDSDWLSINRSMDCLLPRSGKSFSGVSSGIPGFLYKKTFKNKKNFLFLPLFHLNFQINTLQFFSFDFFDIFYC